MSRDLAHAALLKLSDNATSHCGVAALIPRPWPSEPKPSLGRAAVAHALAAAGYPCTASTLQTKASRGGGPPFRSFGRIPLYRWGTPWRGRRARCRPRAAARPKQTPRAPPVARLGEGWDSSVNDPFGAACFVLRALGLPGACVCHPPPRVAKASAAVLLWGNWHDSVTRAPLDREKRRFPAAFPA